MQYDMCGQFKLDNFVRKQCMFGVLIQTVLKMFKFHEKMVPIDRLMVSNFILCMCIIILFSFFSAVDFIQDFFGSFLNENLY